MFQLFLARQNGLFIDELHNGLFPANADGIGRRTGTARGKRSKRMLCGAVLQRMERDDGDPAAGIQMIGNGFQRRFDDGEFRIDLDADGLKRLFCGVMADGEHFFGGNAFDDLDKLGRGFHRLFRSCLNDGGGDPACVVILAVCGDDAAQIGFAVGVYNIVGGERGRFIHTHIKRCFRVIRKTSFGGIELIGGNAEVEQGAVYFFDAKLGKDIGKIREIVFDENDLIFVILEAFAGGFDGADILIDADQLAAVKALDDLQRMAAAAQSTIDVDAVGVDIQGFDALVQKHGNVRKCMFHKYKSFFQYCAAGKGVEIFVWNVENSVESVENYRICPYLSAVINII